MANPCPTIPPEESKYMKVGEKMDITPKQDGGIIKEVVTEGEVEDWPNVFDYVELFYIGYSGSVEPGCKFDSSEDDGYTFKFQMGKGKVVRGFEIGVSTMKIGETSRFYLRPEYGFGKAGILPKVPADTVVIFETTLIAFEGHDISHARDNSVIKHILRKGVGWSQPNPGCMVSMHLKGWHEEGANKQVFQDAEVVYPFGEGADPQFFIPKFVEGLLDMWKIGEKSRVHMKAEQCFGAKGCPEKGIPPNTDLYYELDLKHYERLKDVWEMNNEEKMNQCEIYKTKGTAYFKRNLFKLAKKFYRKMVDNIEFDLCMQDVEENRRVQLLVAGYLNLALVYLKLDRMSEAQECCDKVLTVEHKNVKAFFRRGQTYFNRKNYEEAKLDFEAVLELEPNNKAARNHVTLCKKEMQAKAGDERKLCQNMMSGIGKGGSNEPAPNNAMADIGDLDNRVARGMMTLDQEREAFGETMPHKGDNNHGNNEA